MSIKAGIKKKLNNKAGFSLAELLMAMIIMLLAATIVATGIPAAKRAYENVMVGANADVVLSTTVTALRNELATSKDISVKSDGTTIVFYHLTRGSVSKIYLDSSNNNQITIQRYADSTELERIDSTNVPLTSPSLPLVVAGSELGAWDDLYVTYEEVEYSGGILAFTKLAVKRKNSTANDPAVIDSFKIRVISSD